MVLSFKPPGLDKCANINEEERKEFWKEDPPYYSHFIDAET